MKTAHDIILKPVITENSMAGIADKNTAASKKAIVTLTKDSKEIEFFNSMV